jgi:hypothetical protein
VARTRTEGLIWILGAALLLTVLVRGVEPRQEEGEGIRPFQPPAYATSDSNGRMIAVTGIDVTGTSVLYVIDTVEKRLSVYQADGGGKSTSGVRWVGARNIGYDFEVDGWNDRSEVSYKDLRDRLEALENDR